MAKSVKTIIQEKLNRLKKTVDEIVKPKKEKVGSQLILQPVRIKNN